MRCSSCGMEVPGGRVCPYCRADLSRDHVNEGLGIICMAVGTVAGGIACVIGYYLGYEVGLVLWFGGGMTVGCCIMSDILKKHRA